MKRPDAGRRWTQWGRKTTLLRLILGLLKPQSGRVQRNSQRIGYVPQAMAYDRQFPICVLDLVLLGLLRQARWYAPFSKADRLKALAALERVGHKGSENPAFGEPRGVRPSGRSSPERGGRTRPATADEPTAHLDIQTQAIVSGLIRELRGKMTILMVTHDWNLAVELADRVIQRPGGVEEIQPQQLCPHETLLGLYHRR